MKQFKLTLVLTVLMSMVGVQAFADWNTSTKVQVNGLYYYLDNDNFLAQVTSKSSGYYTGDIEIPFDFIYAGNIYSVTSIGDYAFSGCSSLTSVTIGNSVTSIGNEAFRSCSGLTSITIPNSVMSIGEKAFSNCTKLTSLKVELGNTKFDSRDNCNAIIETASNKLIAGCNTTVIPNSVTSIGQDAFRGSGLTFLTIPNSVTSIGSYAFNNCSALTSVTLNSNDIVSKEHTYSDNIKTIFGNQVKKYVIGDDVTSIGDNAFYGCTGITSFTIGNNVTSIGYMAFYGCTGLATFTIPYKVTSIGAYAFRDCSALESLTIDRSVTSYGNSAFQCSKLTSVTVLNPTPVAITQNVFTNRTNATLYVPTGCKSAYESADYWKEFKEIKEKNIVVVVDGLYYNLDYVNNQAQVTSMPEGKYTGDIVIPSSFTYNDTNYSVTSIGNEAFNGCSGLTSVTIPNSVTSIGDYAFRGCSGLTSVTIGNSVTSIGSYAFYDCSGLTSVTIPNSVTSIGDYAFHGCSGLTSVTIGNSVTSIGNDAFSSCYGLTSITIPNSVTSIGDWAFFKCTGLTSLTIGSGVTSIGDNAFYDCSGLTSVTLNSNAIVSKAYNYDNNIKNIFGTQVTEYIIGNDVTSIGFTAFEDCSSLTSVTIGNNVTSIGDYAFRDCTGLTSITIPNSVTSIGRHAFQYCSGLTSVTIGNSVKSIGGEAFYNCSGLTSITIPNSVTSIGGNAFYNTAWYNNQPDGLVYAGKVAYKYKGTMPANTGISIKEGSLGIADDAFYNCSGLTSVTIPSSVTSIGRDAFDYCSGLTSVTLNSNDVVSKAYASSNNMKSIFGEQVKEYVIGDDVTAIGAYAFQNCSGLTSLTIGSGVTSIGDYAFQYCSGLTSVTLNSNDVVSKANIFFNMRSIFGEQVKEYVIGDDVTAIGNNAFSGCKGLTSVTIGNSVTSIGNHAFDYCSGLTSVTIPNSVTSIGGSAFQSCSGLTSITIPNSVTSIGDWAFYKCTGLTSLTIGSGVTSIGDNAFYDCSGLTKVIISDIAAWCGISFSNSSANPLSYAHHLYSDENTEITDLVIPDGVSSINDYAFSGCSGLTSVTIPESVTSIGDYAFNYCSGLTSVTIGSGVTSIGERAFVGCSGLTSVTIPNSVTSIGDEAFDGCFKLTSVTALNPNPVAIKEFVFSNRTNATLYVPKGSKSAYQAAAYWKQFKEIVEIDVTGIDQINFQENGEQGLDEEGAVWYTIDGKRVDKPKKGINIIRMSDGTTKKVVVK